MKKITYTLPSRKEEITLNQFLKFEEINALEDVDDLFKTNRTIELFTGIQFDFISRLKQSEIDSILSHLKPLLSHNPELYTTFTFNGVKYGLIPNFSKDLLAGEFIDLDVYTEQKSWLEVMSILYRPITFERKGQYLIEPYTATHANFKDLPFHYFVGVLDFFLNLLNTLVELTQKYTTQQLQILENLHLKGNSKAGIMGMST